MNRRHEVYAQCDICDRDIRYGNAVLEISRNVEQYHNEEETEVRSATVIDTDSLAIICAHCGNYLANRKEILKHLAADLGLPTPPNTAENACPGLPLTCNCCTSVLDENKTRVLLVRLVAQVEWNDELNDSELIVIDCEDVFSFCPSCGNKMSTRLMRKSVRGLLDELISRRMVYSTTQLELERKKMANEEGLKQLYEKKSSILHNALRKLDQEDENNNG